MKTSKAALQTAAQGECDVWLDTVQLKGRAKQKRQSRPISKLLNPFGEGSGYNVAVALNFTQTKIEMPKTKQSSISTFFVPQRRVLNKMTTCEVPNTDQVEHLSPSTSSTSLTAHKPAAVGKKRRREIDLDYFTPEPDVDYELDSENVTEPKAVEGQGEAVSHISSPDLHCEFGEQQSEEINPPQRKRCFTSTPMFLVECQSVFNSLQSEKDFSIGMDLEGRTSTQKPSKHCDSSHFQDDKENSLALSSKSPTKNLPLSNLGLSWAKPKTASPLKQLSNIQTKWDKEESAHSQFKWTKPNCSPVKKLPPQLSCKTMEEDSLAMLFTQDSEGFRVIAHRGLQTRSPRKDHSNISTGIVRKSAFKSVVEDEEDSDMLFTQDSQGNLVIKH